jgi:hypothetical protein
MRAVGQEREEDQSPEVMKFADFVMGEKIRPNNLWDIANFYSQGCGNAFIIYGYGSSIFKRFVYESAFFGSECRILQNFPRFLYHFQKF